jgi:hypothetical protein
VTGFTATTFEELYALSQPVTKNNYTTQAVMSATTATVSRCVLSALLFSVPSKSLHVRAWGTIAAAATTTFTFAAGLDPTAGTLAGSGGGTLLQTASLTVGVITLPFDILMDITAQTVGNLGTTIQSNGVVRVSNTVANTFTASAQVAPFANTITAVNNEVGLWLEFWGAWQAAAAGNTTTLQQFKVYGEN